MRVAFVLLVAGVAVLISGCNGGSGKGHSGRGAYFDAIESRFDCGPATPESTPDPTQAAVDAQRDFDTFAKLTPPTEIAPAHRELVSAERAWFDLLRQLGDATPSPRDANAVERARALTTAEAKWQDAFTRHYGARLFRMEGASMEPTFHNNDVLAIEAYTGQPLTRSQVIVFRFPLDPSRDFIKRVIGVPGDTIEVKDEKVYIDGAPLVENYILATPNYTYGPKTVPPGEYFVLGDNRRNSYDSHAWGNTCTEQQQCDFVPKDLILGELPASGATPESKWWCK